MGVTPKGRKPGHRTASIVCLVMDCAPVTTVGWYGDRGWCHRLLGAFARIRDLAVRETLIEFASLLVEDGRT